MGHLRGPGVTRSLASFARRPMLAHACANSWRATKKGRRSRDQESIILIAIDASLGIPSTSTGLRPLQDTLVSEREQQSNKRVPLVPPATSEDVERACTWVKVLCDSACSKIMKDPRKDMRDSRLDSIQRWPCGRIH